MGRGLLGEMAIVHVSQLILKVNFITFLHRPISLKNELFH